MMTTNQRLNEFLAESYRLQVFGSSDADALIEKYKNDVDEEFLSKAQAMLAELDALGAVVNLAQRDFAGYQAQKALRRLLASLSPHGPRKWENA